MNITEKLLKIQSKLNAPKGQFNSFGKYKYRSNEDILNALKPLLMDVKAVVIQSDEVVEIGGRVYVKATTAFVDAEDASRIDNTAFAREAATKKGMDDSQITGSTSSYARKYSLNGLFAIDDSKDADATNKHGDNSQAPPAGEISLDQITVMQDEIEQRQGMEDITGLLKWCATKFNCTINEIADIPAEHYPKVMAAIQKKPLKVD